MVTREPTVRVDLTYDRLEAIAWAVWFAAPAAPAASRPALDDVAEMLLGKRRQILQVVPGPVRAEEPEPKREPAPLGGGDEPV